MSRRPNHSPAFKAKEAIAAIKAERTIAEQFDVHPNQVTTWKAQLEGSSTIARVDRHLVQELVHARRQSGKIFSLSECYINQWCPRRDSNPHTLADIRF